jgi:hypothetical protein
VHFPKLLENRFEVLLRNQKVLDRDQKLRFTLLLALSPLSWFFILWSIAFIFKLKFGICVEAEYVVHQFVIHFLALFRVKQSLIVVQQLLMRVVIAFFSLFAHLQQLLEVLVLLSELFDAVLVSLNVVFKLKNLGFVVSFNVAHADLGVLIGRLLPVAGYSNCGDSVFRVVRRLLHLILQQLNFSIGQI